MQRKNIKSVLEKINSGTVTPEEESMAKYWLHQLNSKKQSGYSDEELERVSNEIWNVLEKEQISTPKTFRLLPRLVAAASVAAVLVLGIYLFNYRLNSDTQSIVQDINPGKNKAILTLANGQKISLTDASNGQVASELGIKIIKTADGKLVYETSAGLTKENSTVEYNTIEAPVGGQWQVKLPDGSLVFLNASSSITYPTRFVGNERKVQMTGEAYFEIVHNEKVPFKVSSQGQTVEVLGTHFNIMAYRDEQIIKTTLLQGSVRVTGSGKSQMLVPGQQAQFTGSSINVSDNVNIEEVIAWKNGYFYFNEDLHSIMNKIARWYDVEVVYQVKSETKLAFGGKMSRSRNLPALLKIMERTGKLHFKIEGRRVFVTD